MQKERKDSRTNIGAHVVKSCTPSGFGKINLIYELHHQRCGIYQQRLRTFAVIVYVTVFCAGAVPAVYSFDSPDEHADIVKQALYDVLAPGNLALLQKSAAYAPEPLEAQARMHCLDNLSKSQAFVEREEKMALNYAGDADANEKDRARALFHLGQAMHTAQDFYCRSNYVELRVAQEKLAQAEIDPYNVPLVEFAHIGDDERLETGRKELDKCGSEGEGAQMSGGKTYHYIAKQLAVRETERRWNQFDALVRRKFPGHAPAIMTSFKEASCPDVNLKTLSDDLP